MRLHVLFAAVVVGALASPCPTGSQEGRAPRVLLRSSWQVVNIGDIAHTPGVLALLEKHMPGASGVVSPCTRLIGSCPSMPMPCPVRWDVPGSL